MNFFNNESDIISQHFLMFFFFRLYGVRFIENGQAFKYVNPKILYREYYAHDKHSRFTSWPLRLESKKIYSFILMTYVRSSFSASRLKNLLLFFRSYTRKQIRLQLRISLRSSFIAVGIRTVSKYLTQVSEFLTAWYGEKPKLFIAPGFRSIFSKSHSSSSRQNNMKKVTRQFSETHEEKNRKNNFFLIGVEPPAGIRANGNSKNHIFVLELF